MHPETQDPRLVALTATLKVYSRWAPHARHDVMGACSPISLDLSLLDVKAKRAPLSATDVASFVERGKESVKNTVTEINRMVLLQKQDRSQRISVSEVIEKMAHSTRTVFAGTSWSSSTPDGLGMDSEYDLTMAIWAALMALVDRYGGSMELTIVAERVHNQLQLAFSVRRTTDANKAGTAGESAPAERIDFNEAKHLAQHLGFSFTEGDRFIELRRIAADSKVRDTT
jgi:hypothetical protein